LSLFRHLAAAFALTAFYCPAKAMDCQKLIAELGNPYANQFMKQAELEMLRNGGCLGARPLPPIVIESQAVCDKFGAFLANPYGDGYQKQAALEIMRNYGCLRPHSAAAK
jgi:hypothetical protein